MMHDLQLVIQPRLETLGILEVVGDSNDSARVLDMALMNRDRCSRVRLYFEVQLAVLGAVGIYFAYVRHDRVSMTLTRPQW